MRIAPEHFGSCVYLSEQSHIGSSGQVKAERFGNVDKGLYTLEKLRQAKRKRDYMTKALS